MMYLFCNGVSVVPVGGGQIVLKLKEASTQDNSSALAGDCRVFSNVASIASTTYKLIGGGVVGQGITENVIWHLRGPSLTSTALEQKPDSLHQPKLKNRIIFVPRCFLLTTLSQRCKQFLDATVP